MLNWRVDQFHNRPLAQCVTEYLEARESAGLERAATVDDIYEALSKGGYKFEGTSGNDENTKRGIKISLTKNTAQFSKVSENVFGLKKWYGAKMPPRPKTNGNKSTAAGTDVPVAIEPEAEAEAPAEDQTDETDKTKTPE